MATSSYRFMTEAIRASGYLRTLKFAVGAFCFAMAVLGCVTLLHPLGPQSLIGRIAQFTFAMSALAVGIWWMVARWPSFRAAVMFMVWADLGLMIAAITASSPEARITTVINMSLVGVFASFLMGPKVLATHCAAACALIFGLAAQAVISGERTWFDTYMFVTPALVAVVVMPVAIQVVIEGGRRAVARTARQALRDPMTGLRNRRGMYESMRRALRGRREAVLVAAAIDLDRFKQLNDDHGHQRGDDALRAVADALRSSIRAGDVAARLGGDEFVVMAAMDSPEGVVSFTERMRTAMEAVPGTITASVGVACVAGELGDGELIDEVLRRADRAMYEAKRQGGNRLVSPVQPTGQDLR